MIIGWVRSVDDVIVLWMLVRLGLARSCHLTIVSVCVENDVRQEH